VNDNDTRSLLIHVYSRVLMAKGPFQACITANQNFGYGAKV